MASLAKKATVAASKSQNIAIKALKENDLCQIWLSGNIKRV